jgi:hypothetical protein
MKSNHDVSKVHVVAPILHQNSLSQFYAKAYGNSRQFQLVTILDEIMNNHSSFCFHLLETSNDEVTKIVSEVKSLDGEYDVIFLDAKSTSKIYLLLLIKQFVGLDNYQ